MDEKGQTLLRLAVESRSPQMVSLLSNRGAAMPMQDRGGRVVLHLADERWLVLGFRIWHHCHDP